MKIWNINEIIATAIPDKTFYLKPLIFPKSITMLYAPPGIGKTFLSLWLAAACAGKGKYLKWESERAGRVLYVDGEMGFDEIHLRMNQLTVGVDCEFPGDNFRIIMPDDFNQGEVPLISDPRFHNFYLDAMKDREIIIFDNYGCLTSQSNRESDEQVWFRTWQLIKKLRAQNKAIVIVHHAGKNGQQLGTSRKEQPLNWLIELRPPIVKPEGVGAHFDLKFRKLRGIKGPDLEDMSVSLIETTNGVKWEWQNLASSQEDLVLKMVSIGMKPHQIATELGLGIFQVLSAIDNKKETPKHGGSTYYYDDSENEGMF